MGRKRRWDVAEEGKGTATIIAYQSTDLKHETQVVVSYWSSWGVLILVIF